MRFILQKLILVYKIFLSPFLGGRCRFYPSCSAYAEEAARRYSFPRAVALIAGRLLRCHPGSVGGADYVP